MGFSEGQSAPVPGITPQVIPKRPVRITLPKAQWTLCRPERKLLALERDIPKREL